MYMKQQNTCIVIRVLSRNFCLGGSYKPTSQYNHTGEKLDVLGGKLKNLGGSFSDPHWIEPCSCTHADSLILINITNKVQYKWTYTQCTDICTCKCILEYRFSMPSILTQTIERSTLLHPPSSTHPLAQHIVSPVTFYPLK